MKSTTLIMVFCILVFFILNNVNEVNAKVCIKSQDFEQNCGWDGNKTCIRGFNKINKFPISCECTHKNPTVSSKRTCKCKFPKSPC
ncbi:defensin-like protein 229 [Raphanus sativus]|uniref:Defensin-like protein 229 n=1 Tax=Raphanus sativus TaxID=3726 RepID=A0A9W3DST6_RAPSA|nr:defensin-like protein 229 [Raphanus sativus]